MSVTATELTQPVVDAGRLAAARAPEASLSPAWDLSPRQQRVLADLLRSADGAVRGFLGRTDYNRVLEERRLADGSPCDRPVTLDVSEAFSASIGQGSEVLLRAGGVPLAVLQVEDVYWPDHLYEARRVHGTSDRTHPRVAELLDETGPVYLGGRVRPVAPPAH